MIVKRTKDILGTIAKWVTIAAFAIGIARWTLDQQIKAVAAGYTPLHRTEAIESRLSDEIEKRAAADALLRDESRNTQSWVSSNHVETLHAIKLIQLQIANMSNWLHTVKITTQQGQVGGGYAF